jgi:hypothetical protein
VKRVCAGQMAVELRKDFAFQLRILYYRFTDQIGLGAFLRIQGVGDPGQSRRCLLGCHEMLGNHIGGIVRDLGLCRLQGLGRSIIGDHLIAKSGALQRNSLPHGSGAYDEDSTDIINVHEYPLWEGWIGYLI